jgi:hypothetical protein
MHVNGVYAISCSLFFYQKSNKKKLLCIFLRVEYISTQNIILLFSKSSKFSSLHFSIEN